jgi:hypothetical protein
MAAHVIEPTGHSSGSTEMPKTQGVICSSEHRSQKADEEYDCADLGWTNESHTAALTGS